MSLNMTEKELKIEAENINCDVTATLLGIDIERKGDLKTWELIGDTKRLLRLGPVELNCVIAYSKQDNHTVVWATVRNGVNEDLAVAACKAVANKGSNCVTVLLAEVDQTVEKLDLGLPRGDVHLVVQDDSPRAMIVDRELYESFPAMWHEYAKSKQISIVMVKMYGF
jgi:hypothetical protein